MGTNSYRPELPLKLRRTGGGFELTDRRGRTLFYTYCRKDEATARIAGNLLWEEGEALMRKVARFLTDDGSASASG